METYITRSVQETEQLAQTLAVRLRPDDVIAYRGGMGMGKTAFTRGLALGLGIQEDVTSPTFALVNEYHGAHTLYHFDMYRVTGFDDLYSTGFFDYLSTGAVIAIEWSENIEGALPEDCIIISFERLNDETRKITVEGGGRF